MMLFFSMSLESVVSNSFGANDELGRALNDGVVAEVVDGSFSSKEVRNLYERDIGGVFGRALNKVLDWRGYERVMPDHYVYLDLPASAVAATIKTRTGKTILAYNLKHKNQLRTDRFLRLYVNLHEHGHVRGEHSESFTESLVGDAARYVRKAVAPLKGFARNVYKQALQLEIVARQRAIAQYGH